MVADKLFYDKVHYKKSNGKSKFGNITYSDTESKMVRYVKGSDVINIEGEKTVVKYVRTYHCPFEVKEGDLIDDHLVTESRPSRDIRGNIHYWIVRTV